MKYQDFAKECIGNEVSKTLVRSKQFTMAVKSNVILVLEN